VASVEKLECGSTKPRAFNASCVLGAGLFVRGGIDSYLQILKVSWILVVFCISYLVRFQDIVMLLRLNETYPVNFSTLSKTGVKGKLG
jgi:hypothetical protein